MNESDGNRIQKGLVATKNRPKWSETAAWSGITHKSYKFHVFHHTPGSTSGRTTCTSRLCIGSSTIPIDLEPRYPSSSSPTLTHSSSRLPLARPNQTYANMTSSAQSVMLNSMGIARNHTYSTARHVRVFFFSTPVITDGNMHSNF